MGVRVLGATLILGLLLLGGGQLIHSAGAQVGGGPTVALPGIAPLAASTNTTSVATTFPTSLWEDASGNEIQLTMAPVDNYNGTDHVVQVYYEISTEVLDDLSCPQAEGGSYISGDDINGSIASGTITQCTSSDSVLVTGCGLAQIWTTTFNATVTQNSITGQYLGQYWTYNTASDGAITDCQLSYNFSEPFSLTLVSDTTSSATSSTTSSISSVASSASAAQQQSSETGGAPAQTSSRSTTTSTSSTSTHSGSSGFLEIVIVAAGVVVVAGIAVSVTVLRKRPA